MGANRRRRRRCISNGTYALVVQVRRMFMFFFPVLKVDVILGLSGVRGGVEEVK
jgi:hypothetical protein